MFDDLLSGKYKAHGRGSKEFDCYGLVIECCRRVGTPLNDILYESDHVNEKELERILRDGLNLREIETPKKYGIVEMRHNNNLHVGFMIDEKTVMHTTEKGVRVDPVRARKTIHCYEVI